MRRALALSRRRTVSPAVAMPPQGSKAPRAKRKAAGSPAEGAARSSDDEPCSTSAAAVPDIEECSYPPAELSELREALLGWYDANHRILPWRRNPHSRLDPEAVAAAAAEGRHPAPTDLPQDRFIYYVWVCEIMSQQTQVARAAEYHRRWVARWPDVAALAAASQEEVNEMWAGLGYYRRARYLLDGARAIVNTMGGTFPRTAAELQRIPGIGAYTSAAIASIALGEAAAVVDGNVVRVLARLRRLGADPRGAPMVKLVAALAQGLLDPGRPGDFNQALMELGATVCLPNTRPACEACPVAAWCAGRAAELADPRGAPVTAYPAKVERAEKREETVAVAVVQLLGPGVVAGAAGAGAAGPQAGHFLLVQRPKAGLLAGLWQFPLLPAGADAAPAELRGAMDAYLSTLLGVTLGGETGGCGGVAVVERKPLGEAVHVFSHIRMTMKVEKIVLQGELDLAARPEDAAAGRAALQWVAGGELQGKGLSSGVKRVWKIVTDATPARGKQSIKGFFKPKPVPS